MAQPNTASRPAALRVGSAYADPAPDMRRGPQALRDGGGARPRLGDAVGGVRELAPHRRLAAHDQVSLRRGALHTGTAVSDPSWEPKWRELTMQLNDFHSSEAQPLASQRRAIFSCSIFDLNLLCIDVCDSKSVRPAHGDGYHSTDWPNRLERIACRKLSAALL